MWLLFKEAFTNWLLMFCTVLSFLIPFTINKINRKLHEYGDPPWKKDENHRDQYK